MTLWLVRYQGGSKSSEGRQRPGHWLSASSGSTELGEHRSRPCPRNTLGLRTVLQLCRSSWRSRGLSPYHNIWPFTLPQFHFLSIPCADPTSQGSARPHLTSPAPFLSPSCQECLLKLRTDCMTHLLKNLWRMSYSGATTRELRSLLVGA